VENRFRALLIVQRTVNPLIALAPRAFGLTFEEQRTFGADGTDHFLRFWIELKTGQQLPMLHVIIPRYRCHGGTVAEIRYGCTQRPER
jgi:hypothetical protein